jgi:hypothetical protein
MDKPTELSTETDSIDDEKMEKPKKKRPPATPAQIEARKKNFEKMLQKRTDDSLALAQKKLDDKLKKKEQRNTLLKKCNKTTELNDGEVYEEPPIETPKPRQIKKVIKEEEDYEVIEEHITKKPKKKRIVYREESDSEEEVIIRKKKPVKETPVVEPVKEEPKKITQLIRFF